MPEVCGREVIKIPPDFKEERILFRVTMPKEAKPEFEKQMKMFKGSVFHGSLRTLICPLEKHCQVQSLPGWRAIKLGIGFKDAEGFREAAKMAGMKISDWANDMLNKPAFVVLQQETEVDLVRISVSELGFKESTRYDKICERAQQLGLQLCPAEVGPQLRLQYKDQPKGEWIYIAMEAIRGSGGSLLLFSVGRIDGGLWLSSSCAGPGSLFIPDDMFVFVRPRK